MLELKYVKKNESQHVETKKAEARAQLAAYMRSKRFARPDVRGFYVVFLGGEVEEWGEYTL